jgi:tubulin-specific chaperone D
MDFHAVGVRRNSFLIAAPQVAESGGFSHLTCYMLTTHCRHESYRLFLIDHLLDVTLRHWDSAMRILGAQSLKVIAQSALSVLGPVIIKRAVSFISINCISIVKPL